MTMTNEELQSKLEEIEKELSLTKLTMESSAEGWAMLLSFVQPYKCKTCRLFHFPEPVKKCERLSAR